MTIGQRIKQCREEKHLTQSELAELIGTTKQNIYKYENGIITNIPSDKIELMAVVFGVSPAYLMGWTDEPTPQSIKQYIQSKQNSQNEDIDDKLVAYLYQHYISRINAESKAKTQELTQKIKALNENTEDLYKQIYKQSIETWLDIFDNLTKENLDKLQEQAELLLLKQTQSDKVNK